MTSLCLKNGSSKIKQDQEAAESLGDRIIKIKDSEGSSSPLHKPTIGPHFEQDPFTPQHHNPPRSKVF